MGVNKTILDYFNEGYKIKRKDWFPNQYIQLVNGKVVDECNVFYYKESFESLFLYNNFDLWELCEEIPIIHDMWI
jgi:hypothetical protein